MAILIDGGLPQAADMLHMQALGAGLGDLILSKHSQSDHAGATAAGKRTTGANTHDAESAVLMARGDSDDIHFGDDILPPTPAA